MTEMDNLEEELAHLINRKYNFSPIIQSLPDLTISKTSEAQIEQKQRKK